MKINWKGLCTGAVPLVKTSNINFRSNGTLGNNLWSSSEYSAANAWNLNTNNCNVNNNSKSNKNANFRVRAFQFLRYSQSSLTSSSCLSENFKLR